MDQPELPVHVEYLGLARGLVDGGGESFAVEAPTDMGGLLECLAARHGSPFRDALYRRDGRLRSFVQVCLDDQDIDDLDGLGTPVAGGREVSIVVGVYPLEGGCA
jgi:hypothetical protein